MIFDTIANNTQKELPISSTQKEPQVDKTMTIQSPTIQQTIDTIKKSDKEIDTTKKEVFKELSSLLNKQDAFINNKISFDYNEEAQVFVVMVKNQEKNEVIKQYPTEEFINRLIYYREMEDKNLNMLLDVTI